MNNGGPGVAVTGNKAGVISYTSVHELELEEWHHFIAVDQTSVMAGLKHTIKQMLKPQSGAIVNVSSREI